mmetsp:Transcript_946/g.2816  ORF Transcript_946/g.2816 Transcript_946/m.2816 type:complete len:223 (-) Transcript_946:113-781(-)
MEMRLASPPLTPLDRAPPILVFLLFTRPICSMTSSTRADFWARLYLEDIFSSAVYMIISLTVKVPHRVSCCSTYPVSLPISPWVGSWPSNKMRPSTMPTVFLLLMTSMRVLLPAPLEPIRAIMLPGSSVPVRGSKPPKRYLSPPLGRGILYVRSYRVIWTPVFSPSPKDLEAKLFEGPRFAIMDPAPSSISSTPASVAIFPAGPAIAPQTFRTTDAERQSNT